MKENAFTKRSHLNRRSVAKLPALIAVVVLCLWPAWVRPCCCAAADSTTSASSEHFERCDTPVCCQAKHAAQELESQASDSQTSASELTIACVCCDQRECPCETRIHAVERLKTTSSHTHELVDQSIAPVELIGTLLTMQMLPMQLSPHFHLRADSAASIYSAADHCAVLCRWLN